MKKKTYIQPNIKWMTMEDNLMAAASIQTDSKNKMDVDENETSEGGGAKENTFSTTSVWD